MNIETRLVDLETKVAFQDDTIQTLSDMVAQQQFIIDTLQRQVRELADQLKATQNAMAEPDIEEVPPHY